MRQKLTKKMPKIIFVFSNNAITICEIKSNEKLIKLSFWSYSYTSIYLKENVFFFIIFFCGGWGVKGGRGFIFFYLMWLEWDPLLVFQRIRTKIYTSTYFPEKLFSKFARRFQILQKLGHFSSLFCIVFFSFAVSLTN